MHHNTMSCHIFHVFFHYKSGTSKLNYFITTAGRTPSQSRLEEWQETGGVWLRKRKQITEYSAEGVL